MGLYRAQHQITKRFMASFGKSSHRPRSMLLDKILAMPHLPRYPFRQTLGKGIDTIVDYCREEDKPELYSFLLSDVKDGRFQTQKDVDDLLLLGENLCFKDMDQGGCLYGLVCTFPSRLCRSNTPVLNGGMTYYLKIFTIKDEGLIPPSFHPAELRTWALHTILT